MCVRSAVLCCAVAAHFDGGIKGNNATLARRPTFFESEAEAAEVMACAIPMCADLLQYCAVLRLKLCVGLLHRSEPQSLSADRLRLSFGKETNTKI